MISLKFYSKDGKKLLGEKELKIPPKGIVIGRSSTCDVRVEDSQVSRIHSLIYFKDGKYYIKDLDSENGTFVNGKKVSDLVLNPGDKIEIGNYNIEFNVLAPERVISKSAILFITIPSLLILLSILFIFLFKPSLFGIKTGTLIVESEPKEAKVYINDAYKGLTPLKTYLNIGEYKLKLVKENYKEKEQNIKIEENKETTLKLTLEPISTTAKKGSLEVSSTPDKAKVYINDQYKGDTPLKLDLDVGTYNLKITKSGYQDYTDKITIEENKTLKLSPKLSSSTSSTTPTTEKVGYLSIDTNPQGADVYINDKNIGKTPIKSYELNEGTYTLRVMKEGYNEYSTKVNIKNGQTNDLKTINLMKIGVSKGQGILAKILYVDNTGREGQNVLIYKQIVDPKTGEPEPGEFLKVEKTDKNGEVFFSLDEGKYCVYIEGPGYSWMQYNQVVNRNETTDVIFKLGRLEVSFMDNPLRTLKLYLQEFVPSGLWGDPVYNAYYTNDKGSCIIDITPGVYSIRVYIKNGECIGVIEKIVIESGKITKYMNDKLYPPTPP
jgi:pSer/pThr/pTyr-binding forkhead associated (FHA) protein